MVIPDAEPGVEAPGVAVGGLLLRLGPTGLREGAIRPLRQEATPRPFPRYGRRHDGGPVPKGPLVHVRPRSISRAAEGRPRGTPEVGRAPRPRPIRREARIPKAVRPSSMVVPGPRVEIPLVRVVPRPVRATRLVRPAPGVETIPEDQGVVLLNLGRAGLDAGPTGTGLRKDGAPVAAGLVRAPLKTPAAATEEVAPSMQDAVGPAPVLRRHVEDELQAKGRVAATEDPPATGLPGAEVIAAMAAGVVGLATPGRRVPAGEGPEPAMVGPAPKNTGPEADAPTRGPVGAVTRVHAVPVAPVVHDGVADVARPRGRTARPPEPAPPGRVPVDGDVVATPAEVTAVIEPKAAPARAPRRARRRRTAAEATVPEVEEAVEDLARPGAATGGVVPPGRVPAPRLAP